jgi:hypothetical protein
MISLIAPEFQKTRCGSQERDKDFGALLMPPGVFPDLAHLARSTLPSGYPLTEERQRQNQPAQLAPLEIGYKRPPPQKAGGINAAVREVGIDRTEAQRAVKVAELSEWDERDRSPLEDKA